MLAGRGRRIAWESTYRKMGTIDLSPLRVARLFALGEGRDEFVTSLGDPARRLVIVLCRTSVLIGRRRLRRSVDLVLGRLARPFERQTDIIVWVVVRAAVTMRVGCWPGSCILCYRCGHNLAGRCNAEHLRNGRWCEVYRS
jgi:hypothetical protein